MADLPTLCTEDYHVAWIAAIRKEYVIACAMLDEKHNEPLDRPGDDRCYTFGKIKNHNVVIARLPEGIVGTDAAASLASDLATSFRNIRFGLMVGIAGGVPTLETDIRLGDIVISVPDSKRQLGGVVQYDFGASVQSTGFQRRGLLDKPPQILLNAVGELQSRYEYREHNIEVLLGKIIEKEKLSKKYNKPSTPDLLSKPDLVHADVNKTCEENGCFLYEKVVQRQQRANQQLVIHLGTVGSGNLLVRNAVMRDELAQRDGIKCLEMESAGLMNSSIRWLVIRGICDYADSHKQDGWQNYAAAVAAVYGKELLGVVRPMSGQGGIYANKPDVFKILGFEHMNVKREQAMPEKSYNVEWVWSTPLTAWLAERTTRPFWISGKPGSGKSTVVAYVSHCQRTKDQLTKIDPTYKILHFFYDYRAGTAFANNVNGMLRMLLCQLAQRIDQIFMFLEDRLAMPNNTLVLTEKKLLDIFCESLLLTDARVCIFLDGLDEYHGNYAELLQLCKVIVERSGCKMCIASRPEVPVNDVLGVGPQIHVQEHNAKSMWKYVKARLIAADSPDFELSFPDTMISQLVTKSEGIILWFKLAFDEILMMLIAGSHPDEVWQYINDVPQGLDGMYERILGLIPPKHRHESALLLFLAENFGKAAVAYDEKNIDENESWSNIGFLWNAYDILRRDKSLQVDSSNLSGHDQLRLRMKTLLRGLLEVIDREGPGPGEMSRVAYIHKTFTSYLSNTKWIDTNLDGNFTKRFPDHFLFRFVILVISQAIDDDVINSEQHRRCLEEMKILDQAFGYAENDQVLKAILCYIKATPLLNGRRSWLLAIFDELFDFRQRLDNHYRYRNDTGWKLHKKQATHALLKRLQSVAREPFTLPNSWSARRQILRAACANISTLANEYESAIGSSISLLEPVLRSNFNIPIAYAKSFIYAFDDLGFHSGAESSRLESDIWMAIRYQLPGYLMERLAAIKLLPEQRARIVAELIKSYCEKDSNLAVLQRLLEHLDVESCITQEHVKSILESRGCADVRAQVACFLPKYMVDQSGPGRTVMKHDRKKSSGRSVNPFVLWAVGAKPDLCYPSHRVSDMPDRDLRNILDLLRLAVYIQGDLNAICCPAGTVLHAVLKRRTHIGKELQYQFSALVYLGIDPTIRGSGDTALDCAEALREWLQKKYGNFKAGFTFDFEPINFVIRLLKHFEQTGHWPEEVLMDISNRIENS